jgi:hypothetical protein
MGNLSNTRTVKNSFNVGKSNDQSNSKYSNDLRSYKSKNTNNDNNVNNLNNITSFNNFGSSNKFNEFYNSNKYKPLDNFEIFHQNIRGLHHKIDEFLTSLVEISPRILCINEHHLQIEELKKVNLFPFTLEAQSCRQLHKQVGVSIFVFNDI